MTKELTATFDRGEVKRAVSKWAVDCGGRVHTKRDALGFTRGQFADLTGLTEPTITRIENGTINPRDDLRWIIAETLFAEVAEIWPSPSRAEVIALKDSLGSAA